MLQKLFMIDWVWEQVAEDSISGRGMKSTRNIWDLYSSPPPHIVQVIKAEGFHASDMPVKFWSQDQKAGQRYGTLKMVPLK
jgi:hypothetical protein